MVLDLLLSDLLALWWLFPAALLIGAVAMTFGIGGGHFLLTLLNVLL